MVKNDLLLEGCEELLNRHNLTMVEGVSVSREIQLAILIDMFRESHTTLSAISRLMIELAKNPDVQEKIYQETKELISRGDPLSYKDVQQQSYVKACVKELFRTRPLLSFLTRQVSRDITLPSGYEIPGGKNVVFLMRDYDQEKYFKDSNVFRPERWLKNRKKKMVLESSDFPIDSLHYPEDKTDIPKFATLPFGHGPRSCIGRRIAENMMVILMIKMANNYVIHPLNDFECYSNTFVKPKGQIDVKLEKRK